ncbi:MAG: MFS transporter [Planctomycetaceae bacterium]
MRALLRRRDFRLLAIGQTLSAFGDYAMFLALAVWVKDLTGSNAAAGLTFLPFAIPSLFGPALGVFVDRVSRRRLMIWTDLAAAAVMLALFGVHDAGDIWLIYVVAFLYGVCVVVYQAARSGLLVGMLPEEELGDANGLLQSTSQAMRLLAPLAGAALFAVAGGTFVAGLDAATFVISALFLLAVHATDLERTEPEAFLPELKAGLLHIVHTTDLRRLTIGTAFVTLAVGVTEVAVFAVIDQGMHRPPEFLGVISSVEGAGSVAAGLVVGLAIRRVGEVWTVAAGAVAAGIGLALFGTAALVPVFAGSVILGVAITLFNVAFVTLMQRKTALEMQGRVMSAADAATTIPYAFSFALGAVVVSVVGFRTIYFAEGVALLLAGAYFGWAATTGTTTEPATAEPANAEPANAEPANAD